MNRDLHFLTKNKCKFDEFQKIFGGTSYNIIMSEASVKEIQTEDMKALVEDKVIKAFSEIMRPVFVDHTGLQLEVLSGLPGGLTEVFWERLRNDGLSDFISTTGNPAVTAVTYIGYCDGKNVKTFRGEISGRVATPPRGEEDFQWDPIFIPSGETRTFAELGNHKNEISMRRIAIDRFIRYLNELQG